MYLNRRVFAMITEDKSVPAITCDSTPYETVSTNRIFQRDSLVDLKQKIDRMANNHLFSDSIPEGMVDRKLIPVNQVFRKSKYIAPDKRVSRYNQKAVCIRHSPLLTHCNLETPKRVIGKQSQIRHYRMWHLIRVSTICKCLVRQFFCRNI